MKSTTCEMKNTLDKTNGRIDIAEEKISELEDSNRNIWNEKRKRES